MKTAPDAQPSTPASITEEATRPTVCMHVLANARTDVRAMRAARTLADAGYAVSLVDVAAGDARGVEEIDGIRMKRVAVDRAFLTTRFHRFALVRAARLFVLMTIHLLRTPADIYHALDLPALPACYIASRLRRKPLIFESYELPLGTHPISAMSMSRRLLQHLFRPLLAHILPRCAAGITVSPSIEQVIRKRYAVSTVLIRNIPEYRQVTHTDRLHEHLGLGPDVRIALYQGNIQPDRELHRLVEAAPHLSPGIVLVLMGKPHPETLAQLEALIAEKQMADRVKILPPVPYDELLEWTASADIGLIIYSANYAPNVEMMLPNKLFEYMMAGLPVLASPLDAVTEIIDDYHVGQVLSSLAPTDIATAISAMVSDQSALDQMRRCGLQAAQEEFHWEKESLRLVELYQSVFYT